MLYFIKHPNILIGYLQDPIYPLENIENAVYDDYKYTETKFHAWIKGDNVRLYYQDYSDDEQKVIFDILVDKNWFFETAEKLIKQMTELAENEEKRYKKYIKGKE